MSGGVVGPEGLMRPECVVQEAASRHLVSQSKIVTNETHIWMMCVFVLRPDNVGFGTKVDFSKEGERNNRKISRLIQIDHKQGWISV